MEEMIIMSIQSDVEMLSIQALEYSPLPYRGTICLSLHISSDRGVEGKTFSGIR